MGADGRTALLAGATGLVGRHVLAALLADGRHTTIHVLLRRDWPAELGHVVAGAAGRFVPHLVDFATLARWTRFPAADDVYSCLGTTIRAAGSQEAFRRVDFDAVVSIARLARRRGATRLGVISAMGADPSSRVFYNRVKGETEAALAALDFPSLTVLRPSLLAGERDERRPAEQAGLLLARGLGSLVPARWRPVAAADVARCLVDTVARGEPGLRIVESDRIAHRGG